MSWSLPLALGVTPAVACAQGGALTVLVENDSLTLDDRHYTSGLALAWSGRSDWAERFTAALPFAQERGRTRVVYTLGQALYTPNDILETDPDPQDRPYAGWLYGDVTIASATPRRLDRLNLSLGVVGPAALGEFAQKLIHKVTGYDEPRGWGAQLANEPALLLGYARAWRPWSPLERGGLQADATPYALGALGNVFTYAGLGLTLRWGAELEGSFGPLRVPPAPPGDAAPAAGGGFGWHLFAGVEGRAVARDLFLDGNSFEDGPSVDKKPLVADLQAGFALSFERLRLAFTAVLRSPSYRGQRGADRFGALSLSWRY